MIDLTLHAKPLARALQRASERGTRIPTFAEMRDPSLIPAETLNSLSQTGLWDVNPVNLFRVTWKNAPVAQGGGKPFDWGMGGAPLGT